MSAVYKKELKTYFTGMTGPVFICFILLMTGIFTVVYNLQGLYPNFEVTVNQVVFVYLLAIPVLTMRSIAEEKHSRTDQLLYSLPMSVTSIVLAKYLAMVTVLAIPVCVMANRGNANNTWNVNASGNVNNNNASNANTFSPIVQT